MRLNCSILAFAVSVLSCGAAAAQGVPTPIHKNIPAPFAFNYDAAHNQITSSGISLMPNKANAATAPAPTTGTIVVTINIRLVSKHAKGSHVDCSLMALGGIIDTNNGTVDGGLETANTHAQSNGHDSAVCTLTIPYSWSLPPDAGADSGLILIFGAADKAEDGTVYRSTLQLDGIENLPANGAMSSYAFDVTL